MQIALSQQVYDESRQVCLTAADNLVTQTKIKKIENTFFYRDAFVLVRQELIDTATIMAQNATNSEPDIYLFEEESFKALIRRINGLMGIIMALAFEVWLLSLREIEGELMNLSIRLSNFWIAQQ